MPASSEELKWGCAELVLIHEKPAHARSLLLAAMTGEVLDSNDGNSSFLSAIPGATQTMLTLGLAGRGWRDWLLALLTVYMTLTAAGAWVYFTSPICPGSMTSVIELFMLPLAPVFGFFVLCVILFSLLETGFTIAIIGTTGLMIGVGLLSVSAQFWVRRVEDRYPALLGWGLFFLTLGAFAAVSTYAFCGSLTA
jgi:hypothetical protein